MTDETASDPTPSDPMPRDPTRDDATRDDATPDNAARADRSDDRADDHGAVPIDHAEDARRADVTGSPPRVNDVLVGRDGEPAPPPGRDAPLIGGPGVSAAPSARVARDGQSGVSHQGGGATGGGSSGRAAGDTLADGNLSLTGLRQRQHWRESTITDDDLTNRGGVFFATVEMTRMPMLLTNPRLPDNPIVFANKAFFDLTGYDEHEVLGRNCRFLQGPQTDRDAVKQLREAIERQQPVSLEILNYRRDGSPFWNGVFIGPVLSPEGELLYYFASQLDVTRRRMSEDRSRQAQKMEAVGQLTAGLAHDFNNLLQVVAGNLELVMADTASPKDQRRLGNAQQATDRATRLTRQLLAFARKARLEPVAVNLSEAITGFADLLDSTLGATVDLQLNLRHRLPPCRVDLVHLETALLNILVNARDAMPRGGTVTISTSRLSLPKGNDRSMPAGDYIVLEVRDEGDGMPPQVRERAIEPFFTTKAQGRGTGLGLAMVHGFIEQSEGKLEIDSAPGEGTCVRIILAEARPEDEDAIPAPQPASPGRAPLSHTNDDEPGGAVPGSAPALVETGQAVVPNGQGRLVLLVEDNPDVLALAREHLLDLGYKVLAAAGGQEAIAELERRDYDVDLVFTDLIMPGPVDGLALAAHVRDRAPDVPVLMATGYNEMLVREPGAPGAEDVLAKPYRRIELADRVHAAISRSNRQPRTRGSDFGPAQA